MADGSNSAPISAARGDKFGKNDQAVTFDPALSTTVKAVYQVLAAYADNDRMSFPSRATIAEHLGVSARTVDAALKQGVAAGLWTVSPRNGADGRMTSNLYRLRDFGRGFVPSNARSAESAPLAVEPASRGATFIPGPRTEVAPELDQENKTIYADRGNSSERTPAARVRGGGRARPPLRIAPELAAVDDAKNGKQIVLGRPRDLYRRTTADTRTYICKAAVAACRKAGRPLGNHAASPLMYHLRSHVTDGMTNHELVGHAEKMLNLAIGGDPIWAHVFDDYDRAPKAAAPDTLDALHEELDSFVGGAAMVDTMWDQNIHPAKIYNTVLCQAGVA